MQISVTFRHMNASDALKQHAVVQASRIDKYFDKPSEAHVVLSTERYLQKAETPSKLTVWSCAARNHQVICIIYRSRNGKK